MRNASFHFLEEAFFVVKLDASHREEIEMKTERKPVVAYFNQRLILMLLHEGATEFRARADYAGVSWDHTALVYEEGGVWFMLAISAAPNLNVRDQWAAEACLEERDAKKKAVRWVGTAQGRRAGV